MGGGTEGSGGNVPWFYKVAFLFFFTPATLLPYACALFTDVVPGLAPKTPEAKRRRGRWLAYVSASCWKIALTCCFWMRRDLKGLEPLQGAGHDGRGVYLCVNHVSYLDTVLVCCSLPWHLVPDLKAVMVRWILRAPVVGRLADAVGHLPLPFKAASPGSNDWSMDQSTDVAAYLQRIEDHVAAGGHLGVFPEGKLNKDWLTLLQFRGGGFEIAIRHDMEVWALVMTGVAEAWPSYQLMGCGPAKMDFRVRRIAASAKALGLELAGPNASIKEQGIAIANHAQELMQENLNQMVAARQKIRD